MTKTSGHRSPATFTTRSGIVLLKPPSGSTLKRSEVRAAIKAVAQERRAKESQDGAQSSGG